MTFLITGNLGDEAYAETERAAIVAARTLVEDGNDTATVYAVSRDGQLSLIGDAVRDEHDRIIYRTTQGRRRD